MGIHPVAYIGLQMTVIKSVDMFVKNEIKVKMKHRLIFHYNIKHSSNIFLVIPVSGVSLSLNRTLNGTEGRLLSPGYPNSYHSNLDYYIQLIGPIWTRLVVIFSEIDLEYQADCLYDFIELKSGLSEHPEVRWCGNRATKKNR